MTTLAPLPSPGDPSYPTDAFGQEVIERERKRREDIQSRSKNKRSSTKGPTAAYDSYKRNTSVAPPGPESDIRKPSNVTGQEAQQQGRAAAAADRRIKQALNVYAKNPTVENQNKYKKLIDDYKFQTGREYKGTANTTPIAPISNTGVSTNPVDVAKADATSGMPIVINNPGYPGATNGTRSTPWSTSLQYGQDGVSVIWNGNNTEVPIAFFGDKNGNPILHVGTDNSVTAGSPETEGNMMNKILQDYGNKPGGYIELKNLLIAKNAIQGKDQGRAVAGGDYPDEYLYRGLINAIQRGTKVNQRMAKLKENKFLSFEAYIKDTSNKIADDVSGSGSGQPSRTVQVSRTKFRPEDFDIAIDDMFQATVGRGANQQELKDFVAMLQKYENKNPQKTVTNYKGNSSSSTTSGGVTGPYAQSKMREEALKAPGAEDYNKSTKYLSYFMDALAAPIKLG